MFDFSAYTNDGKSFEFNGRFLGSYLESKNGQ